MKPAGVYLHIPFCRRKCDYCDFYSLAAEPSVITAYVNALKNAIGLIPYKGIVVDTVYFGGGTPSLLSGRQVDAILTALARAVTLCDGAEITLEANPDSVTETGMKELAAAGVNRISLGVQSALDSQLALLGRVHSVQMVTDATAAVRKAGIENLSLDMMIGLPGQTAEELAETIDFFGALAPEHISAYLLKVEPGTPFAARYGTQPLADEAEAELYLAMAESLEKMGYAQYEISNFARRGYESRHNVKYWTGVPYLGIGPSAHSFILGKRFAFPRDLEGFCTAMNPWGNVLDDGTGGDYEETVMLRLRLTEGVDTDFLRQQYPQADVGRLQVRGQFLAGKGLVKTEGSRIFLTREGMLLSSSAIAFLLS